jgi:hypothetical protein
MIDVQRLVVLREVARAGSFAGAASALHHTPQCPSRSPPSSAAPAPRWSSAAPVASP